MGCVREWEPDGGCPAAGCSVVGFTPAAVGVGCGANAGIVSGGLNIAVSKHIWIRAVQADYFYSELRNLQGDSQTSSASERECFSADPTSTGNIESALLFEAACSWPRQLLRRFRSAPWRGCPLPSGQSRSGHSTNSTTSQMKRWRIKLPDDLNLEKEIFPEGWKVVQSGNADLRPNAQCPPIHRNCEEMGLLDN